MKFDQSTNKRIELERRIQKAIAKHPPHIQKLMYRAFRYVVFCQRRF